MAELQAQYPDADTWPVIGVTWFWNEDGYIREFHKKPKANTPMTYYNSWEYLNYTKEEAIEKLGRYCKFNETAYRVIVKYNSETIFDGKLE
jgi:hypothetical protein